MYQSSPRKNFLDFLIEPTSIAILGSIALHAIIGVSLPFLTQLQQEIKKAEPGTVKVVELTPNELQRIPQAPPIPAPQVATPIPSPQAVTPPATPPISPNSPTIPFSPIRIPLEKLIPQPAKGKKDQQAIPQKQPNTPLFDPNISFNPTPTPTKSPDKKVKKTKLTPVPIPKPVPNPIAKKPKPTVINPIPTVNSDDDGGDLKPNTPGTSNPQVQKPTNTSPTGTGTNPTRPADGSSGDQPSGIPGSDSNSFPYLYGKYSAAATERIQQYLKAYPGIVLYKPKILTQDYPKDTPCSSSSVPKPPFIVLMTAFGEVPENKENNPLGDSTAQSIDKTYVAADKDTPENRKLSELAINTALYEANKEDQNRAPADKGKKVLYQYRVQLQHNPNTCKR